VIPLRPDFLEIEFSDKEESFFIMFIHLYGAVSKMNMKLFCTILFGFLVMGKTSISGQIVGVAGL
jgi:hypothetical protein